MKYVISHYQSSFEWVYDYTDDPVIYDKEKINVGYNISNMMNFIIDNYDNLPDVMAFVKDNMLERHITEEEWEKIKDKRTFTPILTQHHYTDGYINYYKDGVYYERNDSWYFLSYPWKYFSSYPEFAGLLGIENPEYIPFAPGGNYIVPKENILKHPKKVYETLLTFCSWSQINAESHAIERCLYTLWSTTS